MTRIINWNEFDYTELNYIRSKRKRGYKNDTYNPCIIMADTETSKKDNGVLDNHICAWSVAIRYQHNNIVCLYGNNPLEFIWCLNNIKENLQGFYIYIYFHNLAYDYVFLRQFLFLEYGNPIRQLNTKPHYPIYIEFDNGIVFRDSLILAQRSIEKWGKDLNVDHQKAVGFWEYNKIRNQDHIFTDEEKIYIANDVLCGVECIDVTLKLLKKSIASIPWTATGIPREELYKIGIKNRAKEHFLKMVPDYETQEQLEFLFHGGYTHGNRYFYNQLITDIVECFDFSSSYPFCMLAFNFPMSRFYSFENLAISEILELSEKYAFIFKLIMFKCDLKDYKTVMPVLQLSKCEKVINPVIDNGRIICADYVEIWLNEIDLKLIERQYKYMKHLCINVKYAIKGRLPRWLTDYVYSLYVDKCKLKGVDNVLYKIQKAKLNSCYGMTVQKPLMDEIKECYENGDYFIEGKHNEENYEKYIKRRKSILPYYWGVWVTSYAMYNLFELGNCIDYDHGGYWIYSDTDSIYAHNWDYKKVKQYNQHCIDLLRSNGYEGVTVGDTTYHLGVAENTEDGEEMKYKEFKYTGAKRYCKRHVNGKLMITVAGVPKEGVKCLKDDINNFTTGFCFDGETTGKLQHEYIYKNGIYKDEHGNYTADSINLSPCDYLLDSESYYESMYSLPIFED